MTDYRCMCKYCVEARWLNERKPKGSRRMMIILHRHHLKAKVVSA